MSRASKADSIQSIDLSTAELEDLKRGTWHTDCIKITLKGRRAPPTAVISGSGEIKQTADGRLIFKLYGNYQRNVQPLTFLTPSTPGEVIPESQLFDLVATDFKGRRWRSEWLLPNFNFGVQGKPLVEGELRDVSFTARYPESLHLVGSTLTFSIFDDIEIPFNQRTVQKKSVARGRQRSASYTLNAWKFRCSGIDFLLTKEQSDLLTIHVSSKTIKFADILERRVIETLQFILGRPVDWSVLQKRIGNNSKVTIARKQVVREQTLPMPPLPDWLTHPKTRRLTTAHYRKLFAGYLTYTMQSDKFHHPLWGQLNSIHESALSKFLDARALMLTVVIESILGSEFSDLVKITKKDKQAIKDAQTFLSNWDGNEVIKNRISGAISQLLQVRAGDTLRELVRVGAITEEQSRAWQRLRNTSTHSYQTGSVPPDEFRRLLFQIQVLFYHLIFYLVGYKGPYIDYGSSGWPTREYPAKPTWE